MNILSHIKPLGFNWEMYDPFIFCAHHKDHFPRGNSEQGIDHRYHAGRHMGSDFNLKDGFRMYHGFDVPGFPAHPHRGFETVTITLEGFIDHSDSLGGSGRYGAGDVQWMTAGAGIQHSEMFPLINQDSDNPLELFQIWINLPANKKMVKPYYKMLWAEDIPVVEEKDAAGKRINVRIIAGDYKNTRSLSPTPDSWAANPGNGVAIWLFHLEAGASVEIPVPGNGTTQSIYFYKGGSLEFKDITIKSGFQARINATETVLATAQEEDAYFLIVQGKPIAEPVAQYGPFVMNTRTEIQQTYNEYQLTQFGGWPWDRSDPVHGPDKIRFTEIKGEKRVSRTS